MVSQRQYRIIWNREWNLHPSSVLQQQNSSRPSVPTASGEHDAMDTTFRSMYQGLYAFMSATKERRDLLLFQREPQFDETLMDKQIAKLLMTLPYCFEKRKQQKLFSAGRPPGTGKTSCALKKMVETFYEDEMHRFLLLSYTNRAVDEICKETFGHSSEVDFIRGKRVSCGQRTIRIIDREWTGCLYASFTEVYERINRCRILVGTVASISAQTGTFPLKHFMWLL